MERELSRYRVLFVSAVSRARVDGRHNRGDYDLIIESPVSQSERWGFCFV